MNTRLQPVRKSTFITSVSAVLIVSSLMGALSLVPGAPSIARAAGGGGDDKITICHATGNPNHPYAEITIPYKESQPGHEGDIIPAPPGGCPGANNPPPTAESTSTVPPTATSAPPSPTATLTPTVTSTLQPLPTETPLSQPTNTALPQLTNTPTQIKTLAPPTATPTRTNTSAPPTATPTRTNTSVPPTTTPTRTNTSVPPTATPTRTNTALPPTATPTRTNTPVPPTSTLPPTPTRTPLPLPTATPRPGCYVFGSLDVPKAIPDGSLAGVDSVLVIPSPGVIITSVAVRVDRLSHTYDSDLQISLTASNGLNILIADQVGGDGDNFLGTILADAGLLPIVNGAAPFTGDFRPDNPLFQVNNLNSAGTWKLHVVDVSGGDAGSLQAWSLEVCGTPR